MASRDLYIILLVSKSVSFKISKLTEANSDFLKAKLLSHGGGGAVCDYLCGSDFVKNNLPIPLDSFLVVEDNWVDHTEPLSTYEPKYFMLLIISVSSFPMWRYGFEELGKPTLWGLLNAPLNSLIERSILGDYKTQNLLNRGRHTFGQLVAFM